MSSGIIEKHLNLPECVGHSGEVIEAGGMEAVDEKIESIYFKNLPDVLCDVVDDAYEEMDWSFSVRTGNYNFVGLESEHRFHMKITLFETGNVNVDTKYRTPTTNNRDLDITHRKVSLKDYSHIHAFGKDLCRYVLKDIEQALNFLLDFASDMTGDLHNFWECKKRRS